MNESIYVNSKEHEFVMGQPGENFSQKLRYLIQVQMVRQGVKVVE